MKFPTPFWKQRGILGIGGSKSSEESKSKTKFERDKRVKTDQERTTEQTRSIDATSQAETEQQERQVTELLSERARGEIENLLSQLGTLATSEGADTSGQIAQLGQFLTDRAISAEGAIRDETGTILTEARRTGEEEIQSVVSNLATAIGGSTQNSLVQQLGLEARTDLETGLARLGGELNIAARETGTNELAAALQALVAAPQAAGAQAGIANPIAALTNALKGGRAVTESSGTSAQREVSQQNEILAALEQLLGVERTAESGKSKTEGRGSSSTGGFSFNI